MSYVLKKNGVEVCAFDVWSPRVFSQHTGASFPQSVGRDFVWESDEWLLAWEDRPAPPPPPPSRYLSPEEFRDRFTVEEMDAVLALAYGGDAIARRLLFKLQTQPSINLDSPELVGGLGYLVSIGVLTSVRAGEVAA